MELGKNGTKLEKRGQSQGYTSSNCIPASNAIKSLKKWNYQKGCPILPECTLKKIFLSLQF